MITEFLTNKRNLRITIWMISIIVALNMQSIQNKLPNSIKNILTHKLFKVVVMFLVLYIYTNSVFRSSIVTLSIFSASYLIDYLNLKELFINNKFSESNA